MSAHNEHKTAVLIGALEDILPRFEWEDIPTGGGCTAILGRDNQSTKRIMITDGDANSPESFAEDAIAIYWENSNLDKGWASKPWTEPQRFFKLLDELCTDVQTWDNERTPTEALIDRLSEWADDIEKEEMGKLGIYMRQNFADDLRTAISLINTHTKEN